LAIPVRVERREGDEVWVRLGSVRMRVSVVLTPDVGVDDWILVHAGFAIQRISEADARATWALAEASGLGTTPEELVGP